MMKEHEIRPDAIFNRYVEMSAADARISFGGDSHVAVTCVACGESGNTLQFEKFGFAYVSCDVCGTRVQSPRLSALALDAFYRESPSSRYRAEVFRPAVAEVRREKVFRPSVGRVANACHGGGIRVCVDGFDLQML